MDMFYRFINKHVEQIEKSNDENDNNKVGEVRFCLVGRHLVESNCKEKNQVGRHFVESDCKEKNQKKTTKDMILKKKKKHEDSSNDFMKFQWSWSL